MMTYAVSCRNGINVNIVLEDGLVEICDFFFFGSSKLNEPRSNSTLPRTSFVSVR